MSDVVKSIISTQDGGGDGFLLNVLPPESRSENIWVSEMEKVFQFFT